GTPVMVEPLSGPKPQLPPGAPVSANGYAVTVAFEVDAQGKARNMSVLKGSDGNPAVASAAFQVVEGSKWTAAKSGTYRASYTVKFPNPELSKLLDDINTLTPPPGPPEPTASSVVWDRGPTQADYERYFPKRALTRGMSGQVELACSIAFDGKLDCKVAKE